MEHTYAASRTLRKEFEQLITEHRQSLWSYCYKLTGSPWDAEDLLQDTLLKAFAKLSYLYQAQQPKPYLFRIASNTWIDHCRKNQRIRYAPEEELLHQSVEEVPMIDVQHSIDLLCDALPPKQRVVFLLIDVFQFQTREVSELISLSEGAVRSMLFRARQTLAKLDRKKQMSTNKKSPVDQAIRDAYVHAFNAQDADKIAQLLSDQAVMEIIGVTEEYGKEMIRSNSLTDWEKDEEKTHGYFDYLDGKAAFFVYAKDEQGQAVLHTVQVIEHEQDRILSIKDYYYCPEFIAFVAETTNHSPKTSDHFWI
ncbi:RNA polymerase sigma-70 factor, ECF subfamily [Bacillus sp. JCM 19045]|nr:RNA polymerase sigma-70 factor, ECF subfamily [Bacillus sp. JCM 19045]